MSSSPPDTTARRANLQRYLQLVIVRLQEHFAGPELAEHAAAALCHVERPQGGTPEEAAESTVRQYFQHISLSPETPR